MADETITNMAAAYLLAKKTRADSIYMDADGKKQTGVSWLDATLQGVIGAAGMEKAGADPLFQYRKQEMGQTIEMNAMKLVEMQQQRDLALKQQAGLNEVLKVLNDATENKTLGDSEVMHKLLGAGAAYGLGSNPTYQSYVRMAEQANQQQNLLSLRQLLEESRDQRMRDLAEEATKRALGAAGIKANAAEDIAAGKNATFLEGIKMRNEGKMDVEKQRGFNMVEAAKVRGQFGVEIETMREEAKKLIGKQGGLTRDQVLKYQARIGELRTRAEAPENASIRSRILRQAAELQNQLDAAMRIEAPAAGAAPAATPTAPTAPTAATPTTDPGEIFYDSAGRPIVK